MPRQSRQKSETRIYHIMLRGINQQQIFEDEEDNEKFLSIIEECKAISGYKVLAYCLMGNHAHLLIKQEKEELGQIFKRICGRYVYWYNGKYRRVGHLFQDRYKSKQVEDDKYLLTVIRYIHQNPIKAKIVENIAEHKYTSYHEYVSSDGKKLADTDFLLKIVDRDIFIDFHKSVNNDVCLDMVGHKYRITDEQAKNIIQVISNCENVSEFQLLEKKSRDNIIKKLKEKVLSYRQISRLTGVSFGIVRKS